MNSTNFVYQKRTREQWEQRYKLPFRGKRANVSTAPTPLSISGQTRKADGYGPLQENILTLLCYDTEAIPTILASVDSSLFEGTVYRTIADKATEYFRKYKKAAGDHLADLLERYLTSSKHTDVRLYSEALHDVHALSRSINREFVLDQLQEFVSKQVIRQSIMVAAEEVQKGHLRESIATLAKGIERAGNPQSGSLMGLDSAIHTYREFRTMEFPPTDSAMFPVLDHPGITQINGFRGHGKTWVALYMAVGLASGVGVFGWPCKRAYRVAYIDGELRPVTPQMRLAGVVADLGASQTVVDENLHILPVMEGRLKTPINLADKAQEDRLVKFFSHYDVVFLDSIAALTFDVEMNDSKDWEVINRVCMRCRGNGTSIVRLQHLGKDKSRGGIGSSMQEFPVDFVLTLKQDDPETFHGNAIIHATCSKTRNHAANDFKSVDLELCTGKDGHIEITHDLFYEGKAEAMIPDIIELMKQGEWTKTSKTKFANQYDVDRSTVYRAAKQAEERLKEMDKEQSLIK